MNERLLNNSEIKKAWDILTLRCSQINVEKTNTAIETLEDIKLDNDSLVASILYVPFAHQHITQEEIEEGFSKNIYPMLVSLDKLHKVEYNNDLEAAENIRKMFFALTKDVRLIFIKLAFVLAELKNYEMYEKDIITTKAEQALDLFAPLAARLGVSKIKSELENSAFKILQPDKFDEIEKEVDKKFKNSAEIIEELKEYLKSILAELGIKGEIMGRRKHIYSIYKKIKGKTGSIDDIFDLVALRVLVPELPQCYSVLGRIHADLTPLQGRFKDYIATPKSNGYQSLHTTINYNGLPVEVQIRTFDMHKAAEYGYAAHWIYKEKRKKQDSLDTKLGWLRELMDESESMSSKEVIDTLKVDIYDGEIFVQSPLGKVVHLPENATPIDFAYAIHSQVGNKCVGAKVNGKMQPLTSSLSNGDIVEIITSPNSKGPSRDWLKIVKTSGAKNKIRSFYRKEMKEENIKLGKSMLELSAKNKGIALSVLFEKPYIEKIMDKYSYTDIEELYCTVGNGTVSPNVLINKLAQEYNQAQKTLQKIEMKNKQNSTRREESGVVVDGTSNLMIKLATCCHPIPNDEIVGFISQGRGIIVHRKECSHIKYYEPERLIDVVWAKNNINGYSSNILIKTKNKDSCLPQITALLVENKISFSSLLVDKLPNNLYQINISIMVKDKDELSSMCTKFLSLDNVVDVSRQNNK